MSRPGIDDVLARLKQLFDISSDSALSRQLNVSPQTISSWRARQRVPYAVCIDVATQYDISLDWLLMGKGTIPSTSQSDHGAFDRHPSDGEASHAAAAQKATLAHDTEGPPDAMQSMMNTFLTLSEIDQHDVLRLVEEKVRTRDMEARLLALERQALERQAWERQVKDSPLLR